MCLTCVRRSNRFQQRMRLHALRGSIRKTEACSNHSQRKVGCRKKLSWVIRRPQVRFANMILNHYANGICREYFLFSWQTFHFLFAIFGYTTFGHTRHKHEIRDYGIVKQIGAEYWVTCVTWVKSMKFGTRIALVVFFNI